MTRRLIVWGCLAILFALPARAQETPLALGAPMPGEGVPLHDHTGQTVRLQDLRGTVATVIIFWSNVCPWAARYEGRLDRLAEAFAGNGVRFILVNANDVTAFPRETPEEAGRQAPLGHPHLTYVVDERSALARAFGARRVPEVFVFDARNRLVYTGAIDDSPRSERDVRQAGLQEALTDLIRGVPVRTSRTPPFGCLIKYDGAASF